MRLNNEPNPEYDELYAWFLTQEENRPSWVALARRFKPELAHDDPAHESQSDSIRADFTKKRGVLPKRAHARAVKESVADKSSATRVWVKRPKGTYMADIPSGEFSLSETIKDLESAFVVQEKTILDAVKDVIAESTIRPYEPIEVKPEREELINGILSDMHVGLNPNPNRRAMYPVEYGPGIFQANMNKFYGSLKGNVDQFGPVSMMGILDLGDGMDGFSKLTTRGGHELEQNMDNIEQFQTFVSEKLRLAENLIHSGMAKRYIFNNVSNDNHAGDFAAIANMTIQMILERSYPKEVIMFRVMHKPLEHFIYGDHAYIIMHGKDQQYQFKGLPLVLNPQTEKYIRAYIDYHKITSRFIHVLKGDLHQNAYSRCQLFDYRNMCSFAPPSQWVQNNFSGAYSGYAIQRVPKWSGEVQHTDYLLEFERVMESQPEHYVY